MKTQRFKKHWIKLWITLIIFSFTMTAILATCKFIGIVTISWFIILLPVIFAGVFIFFHILGFIFFVTIVIFSLFDEWHQTERKQKP